MNRLGELGFWLAEIKSRTAAFVCLAAYPLFDRRTHADIGGMETRAALLARTLAASGRWEAVFAVRNHGQGKSVHIDGVRLVVYDPFWKRVYDNVVRRFSKYKWRPVIFLDRRDVYLAFHVVAYLLMSLLPKCMVHRYWKKLKPDVVCCFGNNQTSAEVIADCYRSGIKTVLCIASDSDLSADYKPGDHRLNDYGAPRWITWYAINTADYIFVQTERQRHLLKQHFGREGALIRNPVHVAPEGRATWPRRNEREFVLWIGRSDTFHKRPKLLLDVARRCPDVKFLMILNKTHAGVFDDIQRERPDNVTIVERVKHHEIWDFYRRARVFVSTSAYEGFPNTFLQAAVSGAPVVSLGVDPEGVLAEHHCGICAHDDFDLFVQSVRELWRDEQMAEAYAGSFFEHVLSYHSLSAQTERFESLLDDVVKAPLTDPGPGCWRKPFTRFVPRAGFD